MGNEMMYRFADSLWEPIEVDGVLVHPYLRSAVDVGDRIVVSWVSANAEREHGVGLRLSRPEPEYKGAKARGGVLRVGGTEHHAIALWMHDDPGPVEVECVKVKSGAELRVYNRWTREGLAGGEEWFMNWGIAIDELGNDAWLLRCSDGPGDLSLAFDDLIVRIEITRAIAPEQ